MTHIRQRAKVAGAVSGFILAGGRSSRMGQDKAFLDWHGETLLQHMVLLLQTICRPVRIAGRTELPDIVADCGPLGGILTALRESENDTMIVTAVDLPLLTREFLYRFRGRLAESSHPLVACKVRGAFPLFLGIRRELLPLAELKVRSKDLSIQSFIESADPEILADVNESMFKNLNTWADYEAALKLDETSQL